MITLKDLLAQLTIHPLFNWYFGLGKFQSLRYKLQEY